MHVSPGLRAALVLLSAWECSCIPFNKVLGPSGDVLIAPSANNLEAVEAPNLAPAEGTPTNQVQADCLTEKKIFYGSDFLSTGQTNATSASECCSQCKLAADCHVWNWCGDQEGCLLPPNLQQAGNVSTYPRGTCLYKPRPITFGGTLPLTPTSNASAAMQGWTSGIPINGTLLPALPGFELTTGVDLDYDDNVDFYCAGSSTSKPVCQMQGNAKIAASACITNPTCRGFQICWSFPVAANPYKQRAVIRLKAGPEAPLNISRALQNPYCSIYVLRAGAAATPNSGAGGYSLTAATNTTAITSALMNLNQGTGRKLLQASAVNNTALAPGPAASRANLSQVKTPRGAVAALPISTPFTQGATIQTFSNVTFNYTQCYSNAPSIRATIQSQTFPAQGPNLVNSIHTWTEVPFRNSGEFCCAFQDINDYFLNLDTGVLATGLPTYIATNVNLTNGAPLKNYDTTPTSTVQPLIYLPLGQISTAQGQGRQFTFPQLNGTAYVDGLEKVYFSVAQIALGNRFCTPGYPQLVSTVNFLGSLLADFSKDGEISPGSIPVEMELLTASAPNPDNSYNNSCLVETDAVYEGGLLQTINGSTAELCCSACWSYITPANSTASCDVWVLDAQSSCSLKNSTLAASFRPVPATRNDTSRGFISGRRTAVLSSNSTQVFNAANA